MAGDRAPWAPPLVEMTGGIVGHLLAWERHDGSWWAWVSWVQESGGRRLHKVVQVRAGSLRPLERPRPTRTYPGGYKAAATRVDGDGATTRGSPPGPGK
jgi:hypothetical protein